MRAIWIVRPGDTRPVPPDAEPLLLVDSADADLRAAMASRPPAILLPVPEGGREIARLGARLAVEEAEAGLDDGITGIVALISSARAAFGLPTLGGSSRRLIAIAWDAEALAAELGVAASRDASGELIPPLAQVRGLVRLAAAAAGIAACDTACPDDRFLPNDLAAARRDGFSAKIAASPDQAAAITAPGMPAGG